MSTMHELNEWITLDEYRSMTSTLTDAWSVIEMAATSTTNYYSGTSGMATGDHPEWMYSAWDNYGAYMTPPYETTTTGGDTWTVHVPAAAPDPIATVIALDVEGMPALAK